MIGVIQRSSGRVVVCAVVAIVAVGAYLAYFAWSLTNGDYNAWGALLVAPGLVLVNLLLLRHAARMEPDAKVRRIIAVSFFVKLAFAFVNHAVAFRLYGGVADAAGYHNSGARLAVAFRNGDFALPQGDELGRRFIKAVTGVVYMVTGPSIFVGYLVFACFGFWGLYLFYRAFVTAVPEADRRRYALLLLFLPSLLFWTSAIGKEAWMTLALGVCAVGASRLLTRRPGGLVLLSIGLLASVRCRPHLSVMMFLAVLVAYLVRRSPRRTRMGPLATLAGLTVLLVLGSLVASRFASHFGLSSLSTSSIESVRDTATTQSGGGGSAISNRGLGWPVAVPGVLFRPLPFEAHNLTSLAASVEGTAMLVLCVVSRRRLGLALRRLFRHAYLVFCLAYVVMFLAAFSSFSNFGLLARERVQVYPLVLAVLALPYLRKPRRRSPSFARPLAASQSDRPVAAGVEEAARFRFP